MIEALRMFLPQDGAVERDAQGRRRAREQGRRGDHAAADRRRDEDVPRPQDAGDLHAERRSPTCCSGLGMKDAFRMFHDHVRDALRRRAGLHHDERAAPARRARRARHRQPDRLRQHQQDRLSHVRRDRRSTSETIATRRFRPVAMSVLASGAIAPREAIEYVCGQPQDRVDRVRRVEPGQHPADEGTDRRALRRHQSIRRRASLEHQPLPKRRQPDTTPKHQGQEHGRAGDVLRMP